jgi:hypothetical protein
VLQRFSQSMNEQQTKGKDMSIAYENIKLDFDPRHLARLMPFKGMIDIRYYLNGIYVEKAERGGIYLVATDGHTMAIIHDATGKIEGCENIIFSVTPGLASAAKSATNRKNALVPYRVCIDNSRLKVACPGSDTELFIQAGRPFVVGKYPDWKRSLPQDFSALKRGLVSPLINAKYLARLARLTERHFGGVNFWQEAPDRTLIVQIPHVPEMIALIMPMRDEGKAPDFSRFTFASTHSFATPQDSGK